MFEAGNIEMQIAEEMEALSLATELEEAVAEAEKEAEKEEEIVATEDKEEAKDAEKEKEGGKEKEEKQKEKPADKAVPSASEDDAIQQLAERLLSTDLNAVSETTATAAADEIPVVFTETVVVVTTIVDFKEAPKPAEA